MVIFAGIPEGKPMRKRFCCRFARVFEGTVTAGVLVKAGRLSSIIPLYVHFIKDEYRIVVTRAKKGKEIAFL